MSRILVCRDNEDLLLKKSKAFKCKEIDFTNIGCGKAFHLVEKENGFEAVAEEVNSQEEPVYTLITNEFGLYAMSSGVSAKIKVHFCDDGKMIIDVLSGAVLIKPAEDVLLASRGVDKLPSVQEDNILWVNSSMLLAYKQYWGTMKDRYIQDFEYVFTIKGELKGVLSSISVKLERDEVIDISGGKIASIEAQIKLKEEAKNVKNSFESIVADSSHNYDFDDDDEDENEDESEQDDNDFYDGSDY